MSTSLRSVGWWGLLVAGLVLLPPAAHAARRSADAADDDVPVQADPRRSEAETSTAGEQEQAQETPINWALFLPKVVTSCESSVHLKSCKYSPFAWLLGPKCTITACAAGEYCFTPCLGQEVCMGGVPEGEPLIEQAQCLQPELVIATACADAGATKTTVVVKGVQAAVLQPCPATMPYCQNGACVPASQVTCLDSDDSPAALQQLATGQQYDLLVLDPSLTTAGTVEAAAGKQYADICKGSAFLLEQACDALNLPVQVAIACKQFPGASCVTDADGSRCVIDTDDDTVPDTQDNCLQVANIDQADSNANNIGDACDLAPATKECPVDFLLAHEIVPGDANKNGLYDSCEFPQLVSVGSQGVSGNDKAFFGAGDAGFATMAFVSRATNLTTPPLPQPALAVYLRRRLQGTTTMLVKAQSGQVSRTGRFVVMTQAGEVQEFSVPPAQLWVYDTALATLHAVESPTSAFTPEGETPLIYRHLAVSADGRWLAAVAWYAWPVMPDCPLLHDRLTGQTIYLTQQGDDVNDGFGVSMSDDGLVLAFLETCLPGTAGPCPATGQNITNLFWYDRELGVKTMIPLPSNWQVRANIAPVVSGNGQEIFFAADPKWVSLPGNKDPSRIFRYDRVEKTLTDTSFNAVLPFIGAFLSVDAEGRYLVVNAWDAAYLYNATSGVAANLADWYGAQGLPKPSPGVALSRDGRFLVTTFYNDVVWNDTNKLTDVYMVPNPYWTP